MTFKNWSWLTFFCIAALATIGYWLTREALEPQVERLTVVQAVPILAVVARDKVELPSPIEIVSKHSGKVAEVKVKEGDVISVGQALLTLLNKTDRGALEKARAATAQAEARFRKFSEQTQAGSEQFIKRAKNTLADRKKHYARSKELAAQGLVSQDQVSDVLANLAIAQNQLANVQFQAKATRAKGSDYAIAETELRKARIYEQRVKNSFKKQEVRSEFSGVLTSCNVAHGDVLFPGKTLMLLSP